MALYCTGSLDSSIVALLPGNLYWRIKHGAIGATYECGKGRAVFVHRQ